MPQHTINHWNHHPSHREVGARVETQHLTGANLSIEARYDLMRHQLDAFRQRVRLNVKSLPPFLALRALEFHDQGKKVLFMDMRPEVVDFLLQNRAELEAVCAAFPTTISS